MKPPSKYNVSYGLKVSVEIVRDENEDEAKVKVIAPLYKNKEWFMPHSYTASQYTDTQILNDRDFNTCLCKHFPSS